jgi:hypothetical protein
VQSNRNMRQLTRVIALLCALALLLFAPTVRGAESAPTSDTPSPAQVDARTRKEVLAELTRQLESRYVPSPKRIASSESKRARGWLRRARLRPHSCPDQMARRIASIARVASRIAGVGALPVY